MTARKPRNELKIAPRDDTTPKPRRVATKKKADKPNQIATLLATRDPNDSTKNNPNRPLTEKQRLFVKAWASGETILSAAYRAGYADSGAMAYKLAKDPAVLKLYNEEKRMYEEASQMTRKKVMDGLLDGIEMAKLLGEPASVIGGWREIGRMCGYYEPVKKTINLNIKGDVTMKHLTQMDDAKLLQIIKGEVTDVVFSEMEDADEE